MLKISLDGYIPVGTMLSPMIFEIDGQGDIDAVGAELVQDLLERTAAHLTAGDSHTALRGAHREWIRGDDIGAASRLPAAFAPAIALLLGASARAIRDRGGEHVVGMLAA